MVFKCLQQDEDLRQRYEHAVASFQQTEGPKSIAEVIVHAVIDASRYRKERDEERAAHQMLKQRFADVCERERKLIVNLERLEAKLKDHYSQSKAS